MGPLKQHEAAPSEIVDSMQSRQKAASSDSIWRVLFLAEGSEDQFLVLQNWFSYRSATAFAVLVRAAPKRDPGARHEPRTKVRRPAHVGATPFWDRPNKHRSAGKVRFRAPFGGQEKRQIEQLTINKNGKKCYLCPEPQVLPMS